MKRYAVAHVDVFNGQMSHNIVSAENPLNAVIAARPADSDWLLRDEKFHVDTPFEQVAEAYANTDQFISAIEIPDP